MDFGNGNLLECCNHIPSVVEFNKTTLSAASSHTTVSNSSSNKRKRKASAEDKDFDSNSSSAKRIQLSCYQNDPISHSDSDIESVPSPVEEIIINSDSRSPSVSSSTVVAYDFDASNIVTSLESDLSALSPSHSTSSTCSNLQIRGDVTPHSSKKFNEECHNYDCECNKTETLEIRQCPLPALSWANASDVWRAMCRKDERASCDRSAMMLGNHPGLQPRMRAILLDWLIEVSEVYKLHRETYYLAVDYLDRYLSSQKKVQKTHLQLIGITCLFIAAKVEEIYPPKLNEFAYVTDGACQESEILQHELLLLKALNWSISPVTAMSWLGVYMQLNVSNRTPETLSTKQNSTTGAPEDIFLNSSISNNETSMKELEKEKLRPSCSSSTSECDSKNMSTELKQNESKTGVPKSVVAEPSTVTENDAFIYPQFSAMEFAQTARLMDLCSLDIAFADFPYAVIAAAAMSHTFSRNVAMKVSGLEWSKIEQCARWMQPFFHTIHQSAEELFLSEQDEQVKTKYGLGHVCPNIQTDDSHITQTHTISMDMLDNAMLRREQDAAANKIIQQESSPALVCPEGLLTPPASNRKPGEEVNLVNHPHLSKAT